MWTKKRGLPVPEFKDCHGLTFEANAELLVWVASDQSTENILDTVVHEGVHVYQMLCSYIGEEAKATEFQAYTIAYIVTSMLKDLKRQENASAIYEGRKTRLQTPECSV